MNLVANAAAGEREMGSEPRRSGGPSNAKKVVVCVGGSTYQDGVPWAWRGACVAVEQAGQGVAVLMDHSRGQCINRVWQY